MSGMTAAVDLRVPTIVLQKDLDRNPMTYNPVFVFLKDCVSSRSGVLY